MSTRIGSLIVNLALESGAFKSGLDAAQREMSAAMKAIEKRGAALQNLGQQWSLAVSLPLAGFGGLAIKAASDAAELQSAFNQTFGAMSAGMTAWAEKTGDAMGRSTQEMQKMANTFGMFFNQAAPTQQAAADMSKTFAVLAQDLSSFFNVDPTVALDKLRSGLSGESEPLRDFGVFLTEATVKAKAMEMGLASAGGEISEQAKIMARYQLILEGTTKAQGDVARTSDGMANRARATSAQFEELKVKVGDKLEPIALKILGLVDRILTGFSKLPDGAQTAVIAFAGIAAAAGPVMMIAGGLMQAFSGLGAVLTVAGGGFGTLMAALAPLAVPLAAIAAVGAVIYANWEKISPVLSEIGAKWQEAIGPQVQAMIEQLSATLKELWNGPLGEGLRAVGVALKFVMVDVLGTLVIGALRIFGEAVARIVPAALAVIEGFVKFVYNGLNAIRQLLTGDFTGAWESAKAAVVGIVKGLVDALSSLLTGRLDAIWKWVTDKIEVVRKAFYNLYDAVVGNSYVPDMVDGIAAQMGRLDAVMVNPAKRATDKTAQAFKDLADKVQPILDRLFPEARALLDYQRDLGLLGQAEKAGVLTGDQASEAIRRLRGLGPQAEIAVNVLPEDLDLTTAAIEKVMKQLELVGKAANDNAKKVEVANVRVVKSFQDMARETLDAIQGLANSIRGGDFLSILSAVVNLAVQLGSIGAFGKSVADRINAPQGDRRALGGAISAGKMYTVGERGPEMFVSQSAGRIVPNHQLGGRTRVEVVPSPYFDVRVQENISGAAPSIAQAGAIGGERRIMHRQSRRLA